MRDKQTPRTQISAIGFSYSCGLADRLPPHALHSRLRCTSGVARSTARGATNVLTKRRNLVRPSRPLSGVLIARVVRGTGRPQDKNDARPDVNSALHLTSTRRVARYRGNCRKVQPREALPLMGPQLPWYVPRGDSSAGSRCRDKSDARPNGISAVQLRSMRRVARASLVGAWRVSEIEIDRARRHCLVKVSCACAHRPRRVCEPTQRSRRIAGVTPALCLPMC